MLQYIIGVLLVAAGLIAVSVVFKAPKSEEQEEVNKLLKPKKNKPKKKQTQAPVELPVLEDKRTNQIQEEEPIVIPSAKAEEPKPAAPAPAKIQKEEKGKQASTASKGVKEQPAQEEKVPAGFTLVKKKEVKKKPAEEAATEQPKEAPKTETKKSTKKGKKRKACRSKTSRARKAKERKETKNRKTRKTTKGDNNFRK